MYRLAVYSHNVVSGKDQCVAGAVDLQLDLSFSSKPHKEWLRQQE